MGGNDIFTLFIFYFLVLVLTHYRYLIIYIPLNSFFACFPPPWNK